jgi:hypothetical protein
MRIVVVLAWYEMQPVEPNTPYVNFLSRETDTDEEPEEALMFHRACFRCFHCKQALTLPKESKSGTTVITEAALDSAGAAQGVFRQDDQVYCRNDYLALFGRRCNKCNEYITVNLHV